MLNEMGYYSVNDQKYTNKIQAILDAQKTLADVTWNFHADRFDQADWSCEPDLSLDTLYKMRAQQIRDQYDYVIVMCSGGADSTNVVKSFLDNGITVDEIVAGAPMSGLNNWNWDSKDRSVNNTISETKYALFPLLNDIATQYPNVKITFNDYFENIINYKTDEWLYACQDWINPVVNAKGRLDKFKHIVDLAERGQRIGVVWGIDKPALRMDQQGHIYTMISDMGVNVADAPFDKNYPNVDRVLFYWAHDFPEIMIKQAHVLAKQAYQKSENKWMRDLIKKAGLGNSRWWIPGPGEETLDKNKSDKQDWQRGIVPMIYSQADTGLFQCEKSKVTFMPLQHDWFYTLHKNTSIYQMITSDFNLLYNKIHEKYLRYNKAGRAIGFKNCLQVYQVGHYTMFESTSQ
jgi:rhodanese-related sulfurtransferase